MHPFRDGKPVGEIYVGATLAKRVGWAEGKTVLLESHKNTVVKVSRLFESGAGLGSAHALLMDFADAQDLFDLPDQASDLLVYCRPGRLAMCLVPQLGQNPRSLQLR